MPTLSFTINPFLFPDAFAHPMHFCIAVQKGGATSPGHAIPFPMPRGTLHGRSWKQARSRQGAGFAPARHLTGLSHPIEFLHASFFLSISIYGAMLGRDMVALTPASPWVCIPTEPQPHVLISPWEYIPVSSSPWSSSRVSSPHRAPTPMELHRCGCAPQRAPFHTELHSGGSVPLWGRILHPCLVHSEALKASGPRGQLPSTWVELRAQWAVLPQGHAPTTLQPRPLPATSRESWRTDKGRRAVRSRSDDVRGARGGGGGLFAMAKTVAYFYDPDVGNFHYGAGLGSGRVGIGLLRPRSRLGVGAAARYRPAGTACAALGPIPAPCRP